MGMNNSEYNYIFPNLYFFRFCVYSNIDYGLTNYSYTVGLAVDMK